jgi:hypothetical protein
MGGRGGSLEKSDFVIWGIGCGRWFGSAGWGFRCGGLGKRLSFRTTGGTAGDDFDALLGGVEFLLADLQEGSSSFVSLNQFIERQLTIFELVDDTVQFLHGLFEGQAFGWGR